MLNWLYQAGLPNPLRDWGYLQKMGYLLWPHMNHVSAKSVAACITATSEMFECLYDLRQFCTPIVVGQKSRQCFTMFSDSSGHCRLVLKPHVPLEPHVPPEPHVRQL